MLLGKDAGGDASGTPAVPRKNRNSKGAEGAGDGKNPSGKAKRVKKSGSASCRGCKAFSVDSVSCDSAFCITCKRMLDRLSRFAAKEGPEAVQLLRDARVDSKKISAILKAFGDKVGVAVRKGGRKAHGDLA